MWNCVYLTNAHINVANCINQKCDRINSKLTVIAIAIAIGSMVFDLVWFGLVVWTSFSYNIDANESAHAKSTFQCFVLIILIMAHCRAGWRFLLSTPISIIIICPFRKCHCNLYIFVIWVLWIKQSIQKHQPTFLMVKILVNPSTKLTFVQQDSNKIPFNECSLPNFQQNKTFFRNSSFGSMMCIRMCILYMRHFKHRQIVWIAFKLNQIHAIVCYSLIHRRVAHKSCEICNAHEHSGHIIRVQLDGRI